MTELVAGDTAAVGIGPETLRARAQQPAENSRAANTRNACQSDMDSSAPGAPPSGHRSTPYRRSP